MSKLFTVVVKLVVPASDKQQGESAIHWLLTNAMHLSPYYLQDWAYIKNDNGSIPEPHLLEGLDSDTYTEGDAFREPHVSQQERPLVTDFCQRWLPEDGKHLLDNFNELVRIATDTMSDEMIDGRYTDPAYRLWVEEFDKDINTVHYEIKNAESRMMRVAILNYLKAQRQ